MAIPIIKKIADPTTVAGVSIMCLGALTVCFVLLSVLILVAFPALGPGVILPPLALLYPVLKLLSKLSDRDPWFIERRLAGLMAGRRRRIAGG